MILALGGNTSQKRTHDDIERAQNTDRHPPLSFSQVFSDSYSCGQGPSSPTSTAGPSFSRDLIKDPSNAYDGQSVFPHSVATNFMPKAESSGHPSLPLDAGSSIFGQNFPTNLNLKAEAASPSNVPLDNDYSHDSEDHSGISSWNSSNPYMQDMMNPRVRGMGYIDTLPYTSELQEPPDGQFMSYDDSGGMMGYPDPSLTPSSSFRTPGLPFRGLDFIRNYTPDNSSSHDGRDTLWQASYGSGDFRFDPDLQFLSAGYPQYSSERS